MKRKHDVVSHISHTDAAVGGSADDFVHFRIIVNVGSGGSVVCAFVVDHDLFHVIVRSATESSNVVEEYMTDVFRDGFRELGEAVASESAEPALGDFVGFVVCDAGAAS